MRGPGGRGDFGGFALEVYRFQLRHNPPYRRYCERLLGPAGAGALGDPSAIPAVPTDVFKLPAGIPVCFAEGEAEVVFLTSGTTTGATGRHPFFCTRLYRESVRLGWQALGLPPGPVFALAPSPDLAPSSSLSFMMRELGGVFLVGHGGTTDAGALVAAACAPAGAPLVVFGTALAFLHLTEDLGFRCRLPPGSAVVETGGYKGSGRSMEKAGLYALIADRLGVRPEGILNEYSMTELSSQFYARGLGQPHSGPHWARATVTDPATGLPVEDGAVGYVRVLDLANLGSVAAIATQDLAVRRGDRFDLLGRDPQALSRGCSLGADEMFATHSRGSAQFAPPPGVR
jgi:hypothetical protein